LGALFKRAWTGPRYIRLEADQTPENTGDTEWRLRGVGATEQADPQTGIGAE
jgi:hypothetical protein